MQTALLLLSSIRMSGYWFQSANFAVLAYKCYTSPELATKWRKYQRISKITKLAIKKMNSLNLRVNKPLSAY